MGYWQWQFKGSHLARYLYQQGQYLIKRRREACPRYFQIFIDGTTGLATVRIHAMSIATLKRLADVFPDAITPMIISLSESKIWPQAKVKKI